MFYYGYLCTNLICCLKFFKFVFFYIIFKQRIDNCILKKAKVNKLTKYLFKVDRLIN